MAGSSVELYLIPVRHLCALHTEELHNLHSWQIIIRIIKRRRMRWAEHVKRMEEGCIQGSGRET
jgi:hypothetical protein